MLFYGVQRPDRVIEFFLEPVLAEVLRVEAIELGYFKSARV